MYFYNLEIDCVMSPRSKNVKLGYNVNSCQDCVDFCLTRTALVNSVSFGQRFLNDIQQFRKKID